MIVDELLLILLAHAFQWVEFTLEVALEGVASLDDFLHDLQSLCLGDTWTEWVACAVSSNSDSSGVDHCGLLLSEIGVLETLGTHVGDVLGIWGVAVVGLDDVVEELVEFRVGVVGASVNTNARVLVGDSGENAHLEGDTLSAFFVFILLPDFLGQASLALVLFWQGSGGEEVIEVDEILWALVAIVELELRFLVGIRNTTSRFATAHCFFQREIKIV